ncbi:MAG: hypothetical protein EP330_21980 [Deltaproteobacteria bacterium]|nr:MAG: hypothetical protein EP330_21980 [Deltaproteobacteria bacterium]
MLLFLLLACGSAELEARVAELEAREAELVTQQQALEARIDALEARPAPRPSRPPVEPIDGITPRSEWHYEVEPKVLEGLDMDGIARMGRALPHRSATGDMDGIRVSGIRRGSLPDQLGLRNGDVVHQVDGHPIVGMSQAMAAYEAVQDEDELTVELTRRGSPTVLTWTLVGPDADVDAAAP